MHDPVTKPKHYDLGGLEVLDVIEALGWGTTYLKANALKYLMRHERKGNPLQDLKKARYCLDRLIEALEAEAGGTFVVEEQALEKVQPGRHVRHTYDALDHRRDKWSHLLPVSVQDCAADDGRFTFTSTADQIDPGGDER